MKVLSFFTHQKFKEHFCCSFLYMRWLSSSKKKALWKHH